MCNYKILGIDEAGRGPVIGPMIVAAFLIKDCTLIPYFKKINIRSSKLITFKKREKIYQIFLKLKKLGKIDFCTKMILPEKIDTHSLNYLFTQSILFFLKKFSAKKLYIDAPINPKGIKKYKNNLINEIKKSKIPFKNFPLIICENFADENYLPVSAASIVAKIIRDRAIKKIHKKYSCNFGSGYCHDKKTIFFLKNYYAQNGVFPKETRLKWKSFLNKITKK